MIADQTMPELECFRRRDALVDDDADVGREQVRARYVEDRRLIENRIAIGCVMRARARLLNDLMTMEKRYRRVAIR
jgi:hypothetical protein